jgi:hypothetical protein
VPEVLSTLAPISPTTAPSALRTMNNGPNPLPSAAPDPATIAITSSENWDG